MAGQYRIGRVGLFSPGDLMADAATLNGQINILDDADWTAPAENLYQAFLSFVSEWRGFYSENFTGWGDALVAALNDASRDQLVTFEERFAEFASEYKAQTGNDLPGGIVDVTTGPKDTLADLLLHSLQPLIPSINAGKVLLFVGLGVAGLVAFYFRGPIGRALQTGAA